MLHRRQYSIDLVPCTIEDLRIFCGVANSLKKSGLACICSSHDENSKAPDLLFNVLRLHIVYSFFKVLNC